MENAASLLPIVAIAVIFWLLIIRPASRQRKAAADLQAALTVGDDVMLTSGILGRVVGADGEHLELEVAPGVVVKVMRGAVASVRRDLVDVDEEAGTSGDGVSLDKQTDAGTDNTTEER